MIMAWHSQSYATHVGDSFNSTLVAVVAVDPDMLKEWADSEGIKVDGSLSMLESSLLVSVYTCRQCLAYMNIHCTAVL